LRLSGGLPRDLREGSNDLATYREAGEAMLRGDLPYRDFFLEYPPGSLPSFVPPALLSETSPGFIYLFSSEMALILVASLVLVALTARRLGGPRAWPVPALTFAAGALLLYPVAVTRYDAVVALALAVAVFATALRGRYGPLAYASLGFGAAAKLVPGLAVLPLVFARRRAGLGLGVFLAVVGVFFVPALVFGGGGFVGSFAYHAERGLQVESVAASVLMALGWVEGVVFEFGAFEVRGAGAGLAAGLSLPVTAVLLGVTGLVVYRRSRAGAGEAADFPRHAAALILAFMLGSKVLSPQYEIWLLPLAPLCAGGLPGAGLCLLFLASCLLTTQVFPVHYADLLNGRSPGPELLLGRNALLAALWALLLLPPRKARPERTTS
jgi:Glycosyltransferase family 87